MAAAWNQLEDLSGPSLGNAKDRLKQFFWCSVFMTNYDQGGNSQAQADYGKLKGWVTDPRTDPPEAVAHLRFQRRSWRTQNGTVEPCIGA